MEMYECASNTIKVVGYREAKKMKKNERMKTKMEFI